MKRAKRDALIFPTAGLTAIQVGRRTRRFREAIGLSPKAAAKAAKIPIGRLEKLERGTLGEETGKTKRAVARALKVPLGALLERPAKIKDPLRIAVLGVGAGATAVAYECARGGHRVSMYDDLPLFDLEDRGGDHVKAIRKRAGILSRGELTGYAPISYIGANIRKAVQDADLVWVVRPAFATEKLGKALRPQIKNGQVIVVNPGSCGGAIIMKNALGQRLNDEGITVAETHTLPYAVRLSKPGEIRVYLRLKAGVFMAAVPANQTEKALKLVRRVYEYIEPADNVLQTMLQNANPIIHPAVMIANAARVQGPKNFLFYEQGVSEAVGRIIEAMDTERIALGRALGVNITCDPELSVAQGYMTKANYSTGFSKAPGFLGIKAPTRLNNRFITEDVGFGLVFISELGRQIGIETPMIDAVIQQASVLLGLDFRAEGKRTPARIGLGNLSINDLRKRVGATPMK